MGKPQDPRFRDKDTEDFYHGKRVPKFQELSRSNKQSAHRKVVLVYQAKNWQEIILYFPYGASGSRLEKMDKDQYSDYCFIEIRDESGLMIFGLTPQ